jgi:hypothetical protein
MDAERWKRVDDLLQAALDTNNDAFLGESDLLADLHHPVPACALDGGAYELGADIALAEVFLVHKVLLCCPYLFLFEVGRFNLPPGAVSDVEHPHRFSPFICFINDAIDMRLIAVKQVTQLPLCLSGFRGNRAAQGK